jgi:hypothetical protein
VATLHQGTLRAWLRRAEGVAPQPSLVPVTETWCTVWNGTPNDAGRTYGSGELCRLGRSIARDNCSVTRPRAVDHGHTPPPGAGTGAAAPGSRRRRTPRFCRNITTARLQAGPQTTARLMNLSTSPPGLDTA